MRTGRPVLADPIRWDGHREKMRITRFGMQLFQPSGQCSGLSKRTFQPLLSPPVGLASASPQPEVNRGGDWLARQQVFQYHRLGV